MYLHSLSWPSSLSLNRSSVNIKPFGPFFPSVAGLLRCTTISAMTLLTTELPLVTNSDDDDVMMVMMMKISGMTLLTTIITGLLEHFLKKRKIGALWAQPRFECGKCDGVFAYDYAQLHICDYAHLKNFFSQNTHSTAWKFWHL